MKPNFKQVVAALAQDTGIVMPFAEGWLPQEGDSNYAHRQNYQLAMDAQSPLVTVVNGGIPAYLLNWLDPELIEVLVTPMNATEIAPEVKKGTWVTETAMFPVVESTGYTSAYGDYNNNGRSGANVNWPQRQQFVFQTITEWGDRELDRMAEGRIDYAARLNIASALTLQKYQNKTYFFGVAGLQNYGLLNDPNLLATIGPAGGTAWSTKDGAAVYEDIRLLFQQLQTQLRGKVTTKDAMTLSMSPEISVNLNKTNQYNVNVEDQLKKNFPNMKIVTAPEYNTTGGQLVQLKVDSIQGQQTSNTAFSEKMRAHPIIRDLSSFKQKKSAGTWGAIIYRPIAIAGMLGV